MRSLLTLALLISSACSAKDCITHPCSAPFNFAYDLIGDPDYRLGTWGSATASTNQVRFKAPAGYRVRVLRIYGDLVLWPRGTPDIDTEKILGHAAGVLLGLSTTAPDGSDTVEGGGASDNCFLYIQDATKGEKSRAAIDYDTHVGGLLERDNVMVVKVAVWLNTLGLAVHLEPSLVVVFQFEREVVCGACFSGPIPCASPCTTVIQ